MGVVVASASGMEAPAIELLGRLSNFKVQQSLPLFMFEQKHLLEIANTDMPFGKYQGKKLIDVPEEYLLWFRQKGFPPGKLGDLMALTLEIKIEGLEKLIYPLKGKAIPS